LGLIGEKKARIYISKNGDDILLLLYLVHISALMRPFYIKIWPMHLHMLTPLYSHWNTATCFSPQRAILREYWYISWPRPTKYMS